MKGKLTTEQRQKQVNSRLVNENTKLRQENKGLKGRVEYLENRLEQVLLQLDELKEIIFGKKKAKDKNKDDNDNNDDNDFGNTNQTKRDKASYLRPPPSEDEITDQEEYSISDCPDCGTGLTKKQTVSQYIEDVRLPILEALEERMSPGKSQVKKVIKQTIEKGYCPQCKKWHSAIVKKFVAYAINVLRLSYTQTKDILLDLYQFKLSDGEIAKILAQTSIKLNPEYERIKQRILGAKSVHLDETGWLTQELRNYAWVMASGQTEEAVFLVGKNRGKGNALELLGNYNGVRVTDGYAAYKNLAGEHQSCWSHPLRKLKDLKESDTLKKEKKEFVKKIYQDLQKLYGQVKDISEQEFRKQERLEALPQLQDQFDEITNKILSCRFYIEKLNNLGQQMKTSKRQFFTCITHEGVAPTNNKAERKLRHLVLKRKNSFGTKTEKGNKTFAINLSVLMSLWWQNRQQFWPNFSQLINT
jgi:transposase